MTVIRNDCMITSMANVSVFVTYYSLVCGFVLIFSSSLPTFIEENMLSALSHKSVFDDQLNSFHCAFLQLYPSLSLQIIKQN